MCFRIDDCAKRPRRKVAYKVVKLKPNGYLYSKVYGTAVWTPGVRRAVGKTPLITGGFHRVFGRAKYAGKGIYVFHSQRIARCYLAPRSWDVILKVEVDPADWVATDFNNEMSTYRKVTVPEEQPFLDWY